MVIRYFQRLSRYVYSDTPRSAGSDLRMILSWHDNFILKGLEIEGNRVGKSKDPFQALFSQVALGVEIHLGAGLQILATSTTLSIQGRWIPGYPPEKKILSTPIALA